MTVIGWKNGKERSIVTDDPKAVARFAAYMDRTEYIHQKGE